MWAVMFQDEVNYHLETNCQMDTSTMVIKTPPAQ